ncbi:hypothetical protein DMUE_0151 [Dictyocoela muelleri]|nr:hypothetical protein DMUE_0151 [Dictyocoela muelleri]
MSLAGILGMDFLLSNHAIIDLSEGTISLDNKYYELNLKENTTEFESKLLQKTKINAQVSSAVNSRTMLTIKENKLKNKEIGNLINTQHVINLKEQKNINLP